jgi:hypothetical protein
VQARVGHPIVVRELATDVQAAADDEGAGDGERLDDVRGSSKCDALLAMGASEVRCRAIDLRGAESGEGGSGRVDEVVGLDYWLGGR